ncbi:hypothetical protein [Shimia sp. MMG029]|uniref:hypothetical protein n=1 Tax=Shimia sp. MMG029 TaxID=3021978 RepID=UPI0022FEC271|nr:hypothetical protein [Shimia sp. MMG029]MDA5556330.1 hypothetical protein [Shimia sp. MMG029]
MLGLVLWSDPKRRKALIWCEDQKDLAFFDGAQDSENTTIGGRDMPIVPRVGDLLVFDICHSEQLRRATNIRLFAHRDADDLIDMLKTASRLALGGESLPFQPVMKAESDNVIRFPSERCAKASATDLERLEHG